MEMVVRGALSTDLGYGEADRRIQIGRIQRLAKILAEQRIDVIVGALYAHPELLDWNRANLPGYVEVYLKASSGLVRQRDSKRLFANAVAGKANNIVGADIPWHEPRNADIVIDADAGGSPLSMARQVWARGLRPARVGR